MRAAEFDVERLESRAAEGGTTLTELADHLVRAASNSVQDGARHRRPAAEGALRAARGAARRHAGDGLGRPPRRAAAVHRRADRRDHERAPLRRGAADTWRSGARRNRAGARRIRARRLPPMSRGWRATGDRLAAAHAQLRQRAERAVTSIQQIRPGAGRLGHALAVLACPPAASRSESVSLSASDRLDHPRRDLPRLDRLGRPAADERQPRARRVFPRQPQPSRGGRSGLSVMATQLSAITMIGTTGQGYTDGMRFLQFYYALPLAMIILSVTLVPFFHHARVYTAYEYLERRFDAKTRAVHEPAVPAVAQHVAAAWSSRRPRSCCRSCSASSVTTTVLLIALPDGGLHDVRRRPGGDLDRRQADGAHRVRARCSADRVACWRCPVTWASCEALAHRGATGRLQTFDFTFDLTNQYTFWSGTIAALFLFCSYFGTDQSQVQRYLTARSIDEARDVAADERLLEDSAAGARAAGRRARLPLLRLHAAAACSSTRCTSQSACATGRDRATMRHCRAAVRRRDRRTPAAAAAELAQVATGRATRRRSRRRRSAVQRSRSRRHVQSRDDGAGARTTRRPAIARTTT